MGIKEEWEEICQMSVSTIEYITNFYKKINSVLGLSMEFEYRIEEKGRFPLYKKDEELVIVPEFFNHKDLRDNVRKVVMAVAYSCFYLDKNHNGLFDVNPEYMAKGICTKMGVEYVSGDDVEKSLRLVRRKLYDDVQNGCYFEVGSILRVTQFRNYEVMNVTRNGEEETIITVKPIGRNLGKPEVELTEEELYNRCCTHPDLSNFEPNMRKNIIVISGPSGVGKDTVVEALIQKEPKINKTVSVTTRERRSNEIDGVDYYYVTKEEFRNYKFDDTLVEYEIYGGEYYGTLCAEIERHCEDNPLILVVDVGGRRSVTMRYPMAKSIFIGPPSYEVLKERIVARNENTSDQIEQRLIEAKRELAQAPMYNYVVVNDDIESCVNRIANIIRKEC